MRGTNKLVKQDLLAKELRVKEIFPTIQGEGPHAGRPAIFVRFAGCNLRCSFCDTDFDEPKHVLTEDMLFKMIVDMAAEHCLCTLVVFTGGEPMLQPIGGLAHRLSENWFTVQIETAGTVWIDDLQLHAAFVVSPKTSRVNSMFYNKCSNVIAWKYIVQANKIDEEGYPLVAEQGTKGDADPGKGRSIARPPAPMWMPRHRIYFQPCDVMDKAEKQRNIQAAVELAIMHNGRVSLQQHKILGLR